MSTAYFALPSKSCARQRKRAPQDRDQVIVVSSNHTRSAIELCESNLAREEKLTRRTPMLRDLDLGLVIPMCYDDPEVYNDTCNRPFLIWRGGTWI